MDHKCLNCHENINRNYCDYCGQKASTHRYSLKHFIEHDFIHGVWHVDKGILFTIKMLFTRPGHSVREYVEGKRVNYFNFVTLLVLIMAISAFLEMHTTIKFADLMPKASQASVSSFEKFAAKYPKLLLIIAIPLYSLFSWMWFRKSKLNFTEHMVMNAYRTSAEIILGLLFTALTIFYTNIPVLMMVYFFGVVVLTFGYNVWFYYQFFSKDNYSKASLVFRSAMVPVSYMMLSFILGMLLSRIGMV